MKNDLEENKMQTISILGGTGKEGYGLAYRFAKQGMRVIIGSRDEIRALEACKQINESLKPEYPVLGLQNDLAVKNGDIIIIAVPFTGHNQLIESIKEDMNGKLLIDVVVPLMPPKVTKVQMPPAGSALLEAKAILGEICGITGAFHNISHDHLLQDDYHDCDILVCGDKEEARARVIDLIEQIGLKGWDAGVTENSVVMEGLTSILIGINKRYNIKGAGIKITTG